MDDSGVINRLDRQVEGAIIYKQHCTRRDVSIFYIKRKSSGPMTEPYGTPEITLAGVAAFHIN